jgi:hypothetical protein
MHGLAQKELIIVPPNRCKIHVLEVWFHNGGQPQNTRKKLSKAVELCTESVDNLFGAHQILFLPPVFQQLEKICTEGFVYILGKITVKRCAADLDFDPTPAGWRFRSTLLPLSGLLSSRPGLLLNRAMLATRVVYVGRFARDWPRLSSTDPRIALKSIA